MSPTLEIDPKLARRLAGDCCYGACPERALDGSDYCAPHDAHERGRARTRQKRRRLKLAHLGLCVDGCGRKVGKRRVGKRFVVLRRCLRCADEHKAAQRERDRVCVTDESAGVTVEPRTKLEVHKDGYTRVRTTGRGTKAVTREDRDDNLRAELSWAIAELQWVRDHGIAALRSPQVAQLGRIQREEATNIVADRVFQASRLARGVARDLAPRRVADLEREIRETEGVDVDE